MKLNLLFACAGEMDAAIAHTADAGVPVRTGPGSAFPAPSAETPFSTSTSEKDQMMKRKLPKATKRRQALAAVAALGSSLMAPMALAIDIDTGNPDVKLNWDNRVGYSTAFRLKGQSAGLINTPPGTVSQDDGDRSFNKGIISNRFDLFSQLVGTYKDFGFRLSGAGWYDDVYNRRNDNTSPATFNQLSVPYNEFTNTARTLHGRKAELLDAFVFGKGDLGDLSGSFRLGRHALLWGESLFFGSNAIAGTQASSDIIKLLSSPNSRFQEITRPDNQVSGVLQLQTNLSVGAYYKFGWEPSRLPAAGSYFAAGDILNGGERLITGLPPAGPPQAFFRSGDQEARRSGQGGAQLKWSPAGTEVDLGFYAVRFHSRNPQTYLRPGAGANPATGQIGTYNLVYAEGIRAYGMSASATFGPANVAAEVSTRRNSDLQSNSQRVLGNAPADGSNNSLFARGNTAHAQASVIWQLPANVLAQESSLSGEVAWNRRLSVTRNPAALNPNAERDAWGMRMVFTPTYRQIVPGVDLSFPMGLSYFPKGKSSAVPGFGVDKGGDMNIGVSGSYLEVWRFSLNFAHFYGREGTFLNSVGQFSYRQSLKDRDYVSLAVNRSF